MADRYDMVPDRKRSSWQIRSAKQEPAIHRQIAKTLTLEPGRVKVAREADRPDIDGLRFCGFKTRHVAELSMAVQ